MAETELVSLCLAGDKHAWGLFVEKYARLVYWAIHKRLGAYSCTNDEYAVDDIFQETFLSLLEGKKLAQVKNLEYLPGWLAMIATHKTVDFMRKRLRHKETSNVELCAADTTAKRQILARDITNTVQMVIDTFSDKEKIIITLNLLEGYTHKEIAAALSIPINTVSTIIARTKHKLQKELKRLGIDGTL